MNTTIDHLRRVLNEIEQHLDAAPHGLPVVTVRHGRVYLEPTPEDLPGLVAAFGMSEARFCLPAISSGADYVVVPCIAETTYDGEPWRVWAPMAITHEQYRELVAAQVRTKSPSN